MKLFPIGIFNSSAPSTLLTGLVSYYSLGEASGNAVDAHSTNTLTDTNTVTATTGKVGGARQFTAASTEYLTRASNAALQTGDIDFTLAAWVKLDSKATYRTIIAKDSIGLGQREYGLYYNVGNDTLGFYVSNNGSAVVEVNWTSAPTVGTWYHVVGWHDSVANTINITINNGTPVSAAHTTGVWVGTSPFQIGGLNGGFTMDGVIDEVGVWKKVLTGGERATHYNSGSGAPYPF